MKKAKLPDDLAFLSACKVKRRIVERLEVAGPMDRSKEVMNQLFEAGFMVTQSGPYTDSKMFPDADVTRFLFHAERTKAD
jgi:hypothetical protein